MTDPYALHTLPSPTSLLMGSLRRFPGRIAFRDDTGELSYSQLEDTVARFQAVLLAAGVVPDRPVAILSKNRWDAWAAASAVSACGAPPCWLHPLATAQSHAEQLVQVNPCAVIIDIASFPDRIDLVTSIAPGLPIFTLGGGSRGMDMWVAAENVGSSSLRDLSSPDGTGMIGLTGGTTGKSKVVERSVTGVAAMSVATLSSFSIPQRPHFMALGPISHVTGTKILPSLMRGGSVTMVAGFDPEAVLAQIEHQKISFMLAVPTMIYDILDCPALGRFDTSSLQTLLYGGAAIAPGRLAEGLERIGRVFSQLYGQAECYPIAVLDAADHDPANPDVLASCGFPVPLCEIRLLAEDLSTVPTGAVGEICVRSPSVMTRYRDAPEATAEAFAGGWLHTGDLGSFDAQGRLRIVDRKKDMIVSGGFNIYPREIEDVLTSHPDVAGAAIVARPDPRWGEAVHAVIKLRPGSTMNEPDLAALVKSRKGSMLAPKSFSVVEEMPLTAAGKVDKRQLTRDLAQRSMEG